MARYLQIFGKFDLIKSALYIHTEKKPTHCVQQRVSQSAQVNASYPICSGQSQSMPIQALPLVHSGMQDCSPRKTAPRIAQCDASSVQVHLKIHAKGLTTLLKSPFCSPAKNWEIRGGSIVSSRHNRTTNGKPTLTGGITEAHHFDDVPPFFFCEAIKKPPTMAAFC